MSYFFALLAFIIFADYFDTYLKRKHCERMKELEVEQEELRLLEPPFWESEVKTTHTTFEDG